MSNTDWGNCCTRYLTWGLSWRMMWLARGPKRWPKPASLSQPCWANLAWRIQKLRNRKLIAIVTEQQLEWPQRFYTVELSRSRQCTAIPVALAGERSPQLPAVSYPLNHNLNPSQNMSNIHPSMIALQISTIYTSHFSVVKAQAVAKIEVWWLKMKNRKVFKILKETIRSAVSKYNT